MVFSAGNGKRRKRLFNLGIVVSSWLHDLRWYSHWFVSNDARDSHLGLLRLFFRLGVVFIILLVGFLVLFALPSWIGFLNLFVIDHLLKNSEPLLHEIEGSFASWLEHRLWNSLELEPVLVVLRQSIDKVFEVFDVKYRTLTRQRQHDCNLVDDAKHRLVIGDAQFSIRPFINSSRRVGFAC